MAITNEQLTIIRAGLDASAYQTGTNIVLAANQAIAASGEPVVASADKVTRAHLGVERQMESYRRATIDGYTEIAKFAQIQDNLTRAMDLGRTTTAEADSILGTFAGKFGLVSAGAQAAAAAIRDVQIQVLATADAMQRGSQAQAAYNARSGAPGASAPVSGAGYGANTSGGNPLYGDAQAGRQSDLDAYGAALDAQRAKFVPLFAAQEQYEAELANISQALSVGAISEAEAADARQNAINSYRDARLAVNNYAQAQRDAAASANDALLGVQNPTAAATAARGADVSAGFSDADRQRASVDELFAASKRYEGVLETIQNLNRTGVFNDAQTQAAMDRAQVAYAEQADRLNGVGRSAHGAGAGMAFLGNGSSYATREILVMGDEIVRGNWSRIPGSILVLTSHVATLREAFVSLVTSAAGLSVVGGIAVVGAMAGFAIAAEEDNRRIEALQNRLALVRDDYVAAGEAADASARRMAHATRDSTADSRTGASALYSNQAFNGSTQDATVITSTFYDLSKALGDTTTDWKRMTEALTDPAAVLKSLQGQVAGINADLVTHVQRLQDAGDKAGAFAVVMGVLVAATAHVTANETPLEEALRRVDTMFVTADGHGRSLSHTFGDFGTDVARGAVYGFGIVVAEINKVIDAMKKLNEPFQGFETGVLGPLAEALRAIVDPVTSVKDALLTIREVIDHFSHKGSASPGGTGTGDTPNTGNIPTSSANLIYDQAEKMGVDAVVADFATRLAEQESGGQQYNKDGSLKTSSTRALGMMQVEPDDRAVGTTKTIGGTTYDLTDTVQNVQASLLMLSDSFRKHAGNLTEVASDYVGRGTSPAATAERTAYLARLGLGSGNVVASGGEHGGANPETAPGTYGVINPPNTTQTDALKLTGGTAQSQAEALQDKITLLNCALALTGNSASDITKLTEELQKAQVEMYAAVPAAQGLYRAVDIQTTAEIKLSAAWNQGAGAAEHLTAQTKAETEARSVAAPGTAAYTAIVAGLTAKLIALAAATQDVALAQKTTANRDTLTYIQAEASSITMSDEARVLYLAHLKEELELKRTAPNADAAYISGALKSADAIAKQNYELSKQGTTFFGGINAGWHDMANTVNDVGSSIKSVMSDSFKGAEDAFVKFTQTGKLNFTDLEKSIEADLARMAMKMLIEQPIMAALGMGGAGNVWSQLFGGVGGTTTGSGSSTPGYTAGGGAQAGAGFVGPLGGILGLLAKLPAGAIGGIGDLISSFAPATGAGLLAAAYAPEAAANILGGAAGLHGGGVVGRDATFYRDVPSSTFQGAPRFHEGLQSDEFAAILQKGERVLTQKQDAAVTNIVKSAGDAGNSKPAMTVNNFNFPPGSDVDSFRRSQGQMAAMVGRTMRGAG